jgi:hypothetical protein
LDLTAPAVWIAPPKRSSFSVKVVFPASGWAIMANVLRFLISSVKLMGSKIQGAKVRKWNYDFGFTIYDIFKDLHPDFQKLKIEDYSLKFGYKS